jgi:leucyl aminopeptidase (aminopeptidase T)
VLVDFCAAVKPKEKVLLIFDGSTRAVEPYLREAAHRAKARVTVEYMQASIMHCIEPPPNVVRAMAKADAILALTKYSLAHTDARFRATNRGARYLSLPQYGMEQLSRPSLGVDFLAQADTGKRIKEILDKGSSAHITTKKGTDLRVFFRGRVANWAPGFCHEPGMLGSPPDIETNVAPLEAKSEGTLVVDGSIPCESLGLLSEPVRLKVARGRITGVSTNREGHILNTLLGAVQDKKRTVLAEFGIGLNPKARLSGLMLEDEGCLGTVHFGFGSNATIGGKNKTAFHLDMVIRKPTVTIDGAPFMKEGRLLI